jgi:hypothetical protein
VLEEAAGVLGTERRHGRAHCLDHALSATGLGFEHRVLDLDVSLVNGAEVG